MKTQVVASVAWDIEVTDSEVDVFLAENKEAGYDVSTWDRKQIAMDIAYDKLQKLTFADASWDNVHDWTDI